MDRPSHYHPVVGRTPRIRRKIERTRVFLKGIRKGTRENVKDHTLEGDLLF
jgi:hypothetical protein